MKKSDDFFTITSAKPLSLSRVPARVKLRYQSEVEYDEQLAHFHNLISQSQTQLYAKRSQSVLIVFQGMDTSGKDGAIKHVMAGINPQGCKVVSFKTPTPTELSHDFLWRVTTALPERGQIGIFNRSHYEEVLITRVHPALLEKEQLPTPPSEVFWRHRYQDIANYEKYLSRQGYEIIKIFLHISKDEQKLRLLNRFENPRKTWKISQSDITERKYWSEYQKAYEQCIRATSTPTVPWHLVPGDDKKNARLMISQILAERFAKMKLSYPKLKLEEKKRLARLKADLKMELKR